jgi:hypothetical protein
MKRVSVCAVSVVLAAALWAVPADAQDKFTLGYGGGT